MCSEVYQWLKSISSGLNLQMLAKEFEVRGFSTQQSLKYLQKEDLDAFFPSPQKLLLAEKRILHLVPRGKNSMRATKMFQVLLQYFEDRFASFFVDEPLTNYQDLAQDLAKSQSRHVKENASVERKNLVTRRASRRSLEKSTEKTTALVSQKMIAVVHKILQRLTLETLPQTRENVVWTN